jgi:hypothetical protein
MADWAVVKFYYDSIPEKSGVTATAGSTESTGDYDVDYLAVPLEGSLWLAANASDVTIEFDAGVGNSFDADYFAIVGHNLNSIDASVALDWSADAAAWNNVVTGFLPSSDNAILKEFTSVGAKRAWRINLSSLTAAPFMAIVKIGLKTELDYASGEYDPHAQIHKANVNISYGGIVTGIHPQYVERRMALHFPDADSTLYEKIKTFIDTNGLNNFFVAWELANNPTDIFLMRSDPRFNNPMKLGSIYRDIRLNLIGRKE